MLKKYPILLIAVFFIQCKSTEFSNAPVRYWLTKADQSVLLEERPLKEEKDEKNLPLIEVDAKKMYQSMDGFGFSLTDGSAYVLHQVLSQEERTHLLEELFGKKQNAVSINYLRISVGASDLNREVYTYDDVALGDSTLQYFSIKKDKEYLIPILKEILQINPEIRLLASPWTAPTWMKTNQSFIGGKLKPVCYKVYAQYFVKYIQAMQQEGIRIDALTIQNEPENPNNNPSMEMTAEEQNIFIKKHLGKAFKDAQIGTKIVLFDHNCDHPNYPIHILNDAETKLYVDGSAFHLYVGKIEALSTVHNAHPDKNIYFTEQWNWSKGKFSEDLMWGVKNLIIGANRNWAKTVLQWNLASNENYDPHTDNGGCAECLGAITINRQNKTISRNVAYYTIGHASKFIPTNSRRIYSTDVDTLPNVAFLTPKGEKILVVLNETEQPKKFILQEKSLKKVIEIPSKSVATFLW